VGIRCADHATPLYQLKLALTSSAGCGRLVGIVRLRTKTTEFSLVLGTFNICRSHEILGLQNQGWSGMDM
jgi:hypothetical protein